MADARKTSLQPKPCGIIRIAALWTVSWASVDAKKAREENSSSGGMVMLSAVRS
jgi:hypothetical protein